MKPEDIRLVIEILAFLISGAAAVISVTWRVSTIFKDHQKETDEKIKGVFKRFDDHKTFVDTFYVRKDLCSKTHEQTSETLAGIVQEMKEIWKEIRDHLIRANAKG